jgi:O-antigen/teichoic acid export membrane protein
MEATSRISFAVAVAVGIASGQSAVALGIAAAPFVSLVVVPAAFLHRFSDGSAGPPANVGDAAIEGPAAEGVEEASEDLTLRHGTNFALAVSAIMLSEQTLLNAAVLTVDATSANHALAGIVFNVFLITRAPLQLFQAIQTSLLPHLAGLEATEGHEAFAKAIRFTILVIGAFALAVALGLLAIGPFAMTHLFGQKASYPRLGLTIVGLGMGLHLTCGTLNQAALARGRARQAAALWAAAAVIFLVWTLTPAISSQLLRVEVGYCGATAILATALWLLYRRGSTPLSTSAANSA